MSGKIIMLRGLPASGKSTWAKLMVESGQGNIIRVNKDDLRAMVHNSKHSKGREELILQIRDEIIRVGIRSGKVVIVDDTNFHVKHFNSLKELAKELGVELEINDTFLDIPLEECINRDAKRDKPVGKDAIIQMYNEYLKPRAIEYKVGCQDAIICDLDGTLALYEAKSKQDHYERDFENDIVNEHVRNLIKYADKDVIIFTSGRKEQFREQTENFLKKAGFEYGQDYILFMRKQDDNRPDYIVKKEMYVDFIKDYFNVVFVVDDRPQVVRLWRSLGLFVFDVNQRGVDF